MNILEGSKGSDIHDRQHPVFKDPGHWMSLIHKQVVVISETGKQHQGWVYTVDPVSESIVLAQFQESSRTVQDIEIILGHAVRDIRVVNENTDQFKDELNKLCRSISELPESLSPEDMKRRQMCLKSWLEKNRLPVTISGEQHDSLTIADVLVIQPPYGPENCVSTNEIILGRIQGLIKNMPNDHEEW